MKNFKAALIQDSYSDIREINIEKNIKAIKDAKEQGADLIVLSELHTSDYFCQSENLNNFDLAENIPGPSTDTFGALAKELQIVLVVSLFEKRAPGLYHNTAVVFDCDDTIKGTYRKMHIPDDPGYYEKYYFTPGDTGFAPIETSLGKLGVLICWDQWYPEAARIMALNGADILIYPTAIGFDPNDAKAEQQRQLNAWKTIQVSHAIANNLYVLSINRCGFESDKSGVTDGSIFWGNSFAAGPQGEILKEAKDQPETLIVNINKDKTEKIRRVWPYFRDRRIDAYEEILARYIDSF